MIYADPPWRYTQKNLRGTAERHYPTMSMDELCALPVAELAAPDCALFLWATFPQLPEALRLIKAWGFQYKSVAFVWLKKNRKADLGGVSSTAASSAATALPCARISLSTRFFRLISKIRCQEQMLCPVVANREQK